MKSNLKYSIIICTYNRPDIVNISLSHCLNQTLLPRQVIVVDASPDFEEQKSQILLDLIIPGEVELLYLKAKKPSAAVQRNQGILAAREVDVIFFLDDDSFIYSGLC